MKSKTFTLECKYCNKEFVSNGSGAKYCSDKCYFEYNTDKTSDPNGCWIWNGPYREDKGYGLIYINKKYISVCKWIYEYYHNSRMEKNKFMIHICDNPKCVNPEHLKLQSFNSRIYKLTCIYCSKKFVSNVATKYCSTECQFNYNVDKSPHPQGCWLWKGFVTKKGYGGIFVNHKSLKTHRYSYELHKGSIPEGMHILHSCDNPSCVNPDHLRIGTNAENIQDKMDRNRQVKGENHNDAKLTEVQVKEIYVSPLGISNGILSKIYGVSRSTIQGIRKQKIWKHVTEDLRRTIMSDDSKNDIVVDADYRIVLPDKPLCTIGVHDGIMHADDVFAVAALSFIYPKYTVIRTRDKELLDTCDIRVDVGDNYNHASCDYDHHMSWFDVRHAAPRRKRQADGTFLEFKHGPLRSGIGLIWLHYGIPIIKNIINLNMSESLIKYYRSIDYITIHQKLDESLISYLDAVDNGEADEFKLKEAVFRVNDISSMIASYNPTPIRQEGLNSIQLTAQQHLAFMEAVDFAKVILTREVISQAESIYYREKFLEVLDSMPEDTDGLFIMEKFYPWAYGYGRANQATNKVKMIIYPVTNGWMCQTPYYYEKRDYKTFSPTLADGTKRRYKYQAPEDICGLRDEELQKITKVKDALFVHKGGHIGATKTKEGAIQLAHYFIKHGR